MYGEALIFAAFPFIFVGFWLLVCTLLMALAGWNGLQERYPDREERPLVSLHMQSGQLGSGNPLNPWGTVSFNRCLRFDICTGGLRVAVWKVFGPFQRPFLVPWSEITVRQRKFLFWTLYSLAFGNSGSTLSIKRRTFSQIAASSPLAPPEDFPHGA